MATMSDGQAFHPCRDLNCAALLLASGVPLVDALPVGPSKIEYRFADPRRCERLIKDFCAGTATLNARLFVEGLSRARDLRDAICLSARS